MTGGPGGLVLGGDAVERNIVQLLDLVDVLLNLGNVLLDGGHLETNIKQCSACAQGLISCSLQKVYQMQ